MDSNEEEKKSALEVLLEKNAYGSGLDFKELEQAVNLIKDPQYSANDCWLCTKYLKEKPDFPAVEKAIYDTGLCQAHALYALYTRK